MNFIKLKEDLQPTLWSLGQFMFTKNIFSKFSDYKHLLKLINILDKEKILLVSICEPTIPKIC
jgi:hypothetical protein